MVDLQRKIPRWLRGFYIGMGITSILLAMTVLFLPNDAMLSIGILLAMNIFLIGIARIAAAVSEKDTLFLVQVINCIVGILIIVLGIAAVVFSKDAFEIFIVLLTLGLLFSGFARILMGLYVSEIEKKVRYTLIIVGVLSVVSSLIVLSLSDTGNTALVYVVAVVFILNGITRILYGYSGLKNRD